MKNRFSLRGVILLILASFFASTLISLFSLRTVLQSGMRDNAVITAGKIYDDICIELEKPLTAGNVIAGDSLLADLLKREDELPSSEFEALMKDYLSTLAKKMNYSSVFVVSSASMRYYSNEGFNKVVSPETDEHDIWYSLFLKSGKSSDFDIDVDQVNQNAWTLFSNNRLEDKHGTLLGVCGVGVTLSHLQELLSEQQQSQDISINLVNEAGLVQVDVDDINIERAILSNVELDETHGDYVYSPTEQGYTITRYLQDLGFFLVVQKENRSSTVYTSLILKNLTIMTLLLLVVGASIAMLMRGERKRNRGYDLLQGLDSLAGIYQQIYLINLPAGHMHSSNDSDDEIPLSSLPELICGFGDEQYKEELAAFGDISTLEERMKGRTSITLEYLSQNSWYRARFVSAAHNLPGRYILAVENIEEEKKRENRLLYLSETDLMTGIRNRGSGEKRISELIRMGKQGTLFLLDANKLKTINDTYGHAIGDRVIIAVADCLKRSFRGRDIVLRLGGDEFAVFAVDVTDPAVAQTLISRLFGCIEALHMEDAENVQITVSAGGAIYDGKTSVTFEDLYRGADEALYRSKKAGGNHFEMHNGK